MEKLIELVYYYNFEVKTFEVGIGLPNSDTDYYGWTIDKEKEIRKYKLKIISKEYGFIKRLVENDKIDLEKLEKQLLKIGIYKNVGYYEGLLMLLSIQDKPIEFLISVLK